VDTAEVTQADLPCVPRRRKVGDRGDDRRDARARG